MAARTHIVDSGGTSRLVKRMIVVDSGGTSRIVKRAFVIDSGGTARQIFSGDITKYSGTMTEGGSEDAGPPYYTQAGYSSGYIGSVSPTTLIDGKTLLTVWDTSYPSAPSVLSISGFSSDPGAAYVKSITANGVTKLASAAIYSYSGGQANWVWSSFFGFDGIGTTPVIITGPP